ncbi:hypothetical protein H4O18_18715 [Arenibacter sp. BSSL-BM3]|uniref:DoxX family protein n=1 Tax=Arenibacter arenosicollis TaxID=2762274 RepID=A0ABR7QSJ2_9FLAO|nr:DUF6544 family protein [Arenibacter arenosicollis]MBC8770039.1 hypothetical protein [Arenibacter arenosicollis]
MRIAVIIILVIHGLIHFVGFAKAFHLGDMAQFTKEISRPIGLLWLLTALLFLVTAIPILLKKDWWPILGISVVFLSQYLIFTVWADAKYGTIPNVIIFCVAIAGLGNLIFENSYKEDVISVMTDKSPVNEVLTEKDLGPLPICVQKYLKYVGVVGKPKVINVRIVFEGEMRERGKDWFHFRSEQYNFFGSPTRLFFMKAKVNGIPTSGYHKYNKDGASMRIKLLSLFPVVDIDKPQLYPTETVTFFNDLCLFAPAALIDDRITWEPIDLLSTKAIFTNNGTSISAILYFNEKGQLVNFVSNDRYSVSELKVFPFSTPASSYRDVNGYQLPTYGEAIWHYPEGEFVYGKFRVMDIDYNVTD